MILVRSAASGGVLVTGNPADLAGLTASFQGFLTVSPAPSGPAAHPLVALTDTPPEGARWERLVFASRFEPDRVLYVDHERRAVTVCGPAGAWRTLQALRTIRNLLRWQAFTAGQLFLHGGMVAFDGRGTAFLGGKRAGKTSSILSALLAGGASFVSNDDLTVELTEDHAPTGHGWPRSVNVRADTLVSLESVRPGITERVLAASHPTNGWDGEHRSGNGGLPRSVWTYPAELAAELDFPLVPRARLTALVLPRFDADRATPELERITPDEAGELLRPHVETAASHYDAFLQGWYSDQGPARRQEALDALLELPAYRLHQDLPSLTAAARLVRTAVLNEPTET
ncbi:hypothetical protein [Streptomyces sp. AN091965]|uniref:hypothetical protein n=1 Tax=Streptomyces sp. AN091965 TaxID=2927803 RepID=UPI001F606160|nr:hypothetical protein [Streptomyces sp. AN091965]MCI3934371.1 hypothetical protein [Streptomyces sp. AN091965]